MARSVSFCHVFGTNVAQVVAAQVQGVQRAVDHQRVGQVSGPHGTHVVVAEEDGVQCAVVADSAGQVSAWRLQVPSSCRRG